jgi:hypothetical protein
MLSGNLELFALADVLRFVARSGATGAVNIYRHADAGRLLLSEGEVVGASVDGFEAGDEDSVVEAGLRLIDGGVGDFALDIEDVEGPIRTSVEDFLKSVARRRAEWAKIVSAVGALDEPLLLDPQVPAGTSEITLSPLEWQIAVGADGQRSIRDLSGELGVSDFTIATAVLAMSNAGLLGLHGTGEPAAVEHHDEVDADNDDGELHDEVEEMGHGDVSDEEDHDPAEGFAEVVESDEDMDPAALLRELGQRDAPRAKRLTAASRQDSRLRLRSR